MKKTAVTFKPKQVAALLAKSHIDQYVRKDGTVVQAHDDKRMAAAPKQVHSDHASRQITAAGGQALTTSSSGINYYHRGEKKTLPHKDAPDGNRYVDHGELQSHLSALQPKAAAAAPMPAHVQKMVSDVAQSSAKPEHKQAAIDAIVAQHGGAKKPTSWQEVQHHAVAAGAKTRSGVAVYSSPELAHKAANSDDRPKGGAFVMTHPDHDHHVVVGGADAMRMEKNGYKHAKPGAAAQARKVTVRSSVAASAALYDKDQSGLGPHKVGDTVSYKGERGSTRTGKVKGARDGKVVVEHKAGYTELKHHADLLPASAKTGSAAPAKKVNIGSEKWPLHAKSSEKLSAKHADGSTHHVGGFKAPEYPENGGSTDGDTYIHHDGKAFTFTGKKGKNMKTGEDSYEFSHKDDDRGVEHRAWVTRSGHLMND